MLVAFEVLVSPVDRAFVAFSVELSYYNSTDMATLRLEVPFMCKYEQQSTYIYIRHKIIQLKQLEHG